VAAPASRTSSAVPLGSNAPAAKSTPTVPVTPADSSRLKALAGVYEPTAAVGPLKASGTLLDLQLLPPASQVAADIPEDFDRIVSRAMEKDRDLRYQSAADLRSDLKRLGRATDSSRLAIGATGRFATAGAPASPAAGTAAGRVPAVPSVASRFPRWALAAPVATLAIIAAVLYWRAAQTPALGSLKPDPFQPTLDEPSRMRKRDREVIKSRLIASTVRRPSWKRSPGIAPRKFSEHGIDEPGRVRLSHRANHLDRFTDGRVRRYAIQVQELIRAAPKDGPNLRHHIVDRTTAGHGDARIDFRAPAQRPRCDFEKERAIADIANVGSLALRFCRERRPSALD